MNNGISPNSNTVVSQGFTLKSCLKKKEGNFATKKVGLSNPFKVFLKFTANLFKSKSINERSVKVRFNEELQTNGTNPVIDTPWRDKLNKKMTAHSFDKSSLKGMSTEDIVAALYDNKVLSWKEVGEIIKDKVDLEGCHLEASDKELEYLKAEYEAFNNDLHESRLNRDLDEIMEDAYLDMEWYEYLRDRIVGDESLEKELRGKNSEEIHEIFLRHEIITIKESVQIKKDCVDLEGSPYW